METQSVQVTTLLQRSDDNRREHQRIQSNTTCLVKTRSGMFECRVRNLSVSGALLTDGPRLQRGCPLVIALRIPLYPEVRIPAKVVRNGVDDEGRPFMGIAFIHRTDVTEDHIQAALLSELERSRTDGCIADVLLS